MKGPYHMLLDNTDARQPNMFLQNELRHVTDADKEIDDFLNMLMEEPKQQNQVPLVKIKCEDDSNDFQKNESNDCFLEEMSPFSQSGVSSPASSYGNLSAPGSPSMMVEQPPPPPYSQNFLTPESAMYMTNPASPSNYSIGSQSPTYSNGGQSPTYGGQSPNYNSGNQSPDTNYKYDPRPLGRKKRRNLVPDEKKTNEYWERRKRNNIAARRSREERRNKELQTFQHMKNLQQENMTLKQTVSMLMKSQQELQGEVTMLKQLLEQSFKVQ